MALAFRLCIGKQPLNGLFNRLCKVPKYSNVQVACISGKMNRCRRSRPEPYPYKERDFTLYDMYENSYARYDENSRIIVVEGPIAAGKDAFAKELALELEMGYMPSQSFDIYFKDHSGFDIRSINHMLPEHAQVCDIERFLTNPHHKNIAAFQLAHYMMKLQAYVESLLHLLSTGEGVVLNRCLYSDFVFMKAMYNAGYINRRCRNFYDKVVRATGTLCMKPHLVIYLDVPVNIVKERIKKRCIPYEVNSKVLTTKYLTDIETIYKNEYLPLIENHAYVLMYDWSCGGDINDIVEDIERIDFEYTKLHPEKLEDWVFTNLTDLSSRRVIYSREERHRLMSEGFIDDIENEHMVLLGKDVEKKWQLIEENAPEYDEGYNPEVDKNLLFKNEDKYTRGFPNVISYKELEQLS
ncbi:hypothetical protein KPH14_008426 [Odynerus spinipes]|uniref:NADH dehydrogenase [ubiquinone] 1 alpha subcomplex subunit 10, mitochondrial n=1 Tax=Odynerus spinipes TaxID=1348599 RepID=A0AAD9VLE2_9HYME|nr:hypothetical protein KPH14_008426 [Odynerus spinipes]